MNHREFARQHVIIISAPNGARRTLRDHPLIPMTPDELADCASSLVDAGVAVLHLHVRDKDQAHTLDVGAYRAAIEAIQAQVGERLIIQVTTEAAGLYERDQQMAMVRELRPEAVSLSLSELCPDESCVPEAARFYRWIQRENIWPQHILYSPKEVRRFSELRRRGVFGEEHPFCLFVLGRYSTRTEGQLTDLQPFLSAGNPEDYPWAVCCFGKNENQIMVAATSMGGHVRIGFENNLWLADGSLARDNAELIDVYLNSVASPGNDGAPELAPREPARAEEIRELLL